jgi:hypothetical protein
VGFHTGSRSRVDVDVVEEDENRLLVSARSRALLHMAREQRGDGIAGKCGRRERRSSATSCRRGSVIVMMVSMDD